MEIKDYTNSSNIPKASLITKKATAAKGFTSNAK
jgi:hypothetical protein